LLNYGTDTKESQLQNQFYFKDTSKYLDDADSISGNNQSLITRAQYCKQSQTVDLEGSLASYIFKSDRLLLNNVELRLKLYRSNSAFCLMRN
jgi:hypothetical protein